MLQSAPANSSAAVPPVSLRTCLTGRCLAGAVQQPLLPAIPTLNAAFAKPCVKGLGSGSAQQETVVWTLSCALRTKTACLLMPCKPCTHAHCDCQPPALSLSQLQQRQELVTNGSYLVTSALERCGASPDSSVCSSHGKLCPYGLPAVTLSSHKGNALQVQVSHPQGYHPWMSKPAQVPPNQSRGAKLQQSPSHQGSAHALLLQRNQLAQLRAPQRKRAQRKGQTARHARGLLVALLLLQLQLRQNKSFLQL